MQLRVKQTCLAITLSLISVCSYSSDVLRDTGTVDALVKHGQLKYQKEQEAIRNAAKNRLNPPAPTTEKKEEKTDLFKSMESHSAQLQKKPVARIHFVGSYAAGEVREAEIMYKGHSAIYQVGDVLPKGFKLISVSDAHIKIRHQKTGQIQTLYIKALIQIPQLDFDMEAAS